MSLLSRLLAFAEPKPKAPERGEIASTLDGRDITRGYVQAMTRLIPQDSILNERLNGDYSLYREVLRDAQVAAMLQQRRLALLRTEWEVIPGGEKRADKQAATLVEETLERIRWDAVCSAMHFGLFYGFAVAECFWGLDGSRVVLEGVRVRDRARFLFDGRQELRLRTLANADGEVLPERKFWCFRTGADHDDEPYGLGLAHWLYWPVLFKRANIKFWLIAAEKFGSPTVMGMFPPSATQEQQDKLLSTLSAIQTDAGLILPEDMKIELLESARTGGQDYSTLCDYMDRAISKLVVGQVMTSEAVGGQYKAEVQDAVKDDIVKADADLICDSFNRGPVRWLVDWNLPGAAYPKVWRQMDEGEDLNTRATREKTVFDMGFKPTLEHIQEVYGGDWTEKAADTPAALVPTPPEEAPDEDPGEGLGDDAADAEDGAFAERDVPAAQALIDAQGDQDPGWDAAMRALLKPMMDALEHGLPPEDILARMDEWYPAMDDAALVDLLTRAIAAAETVGRLEAQSGGRA